MKAQTLSNVKHFIALAVAVQSVSAFVIYYYVALNYAIKLKELYFLGVTINFAFIFALLFILLCNKYIRAVLMGCSSFFLGISITYILDWIKCPKPSLNHVYECLFFGIGISILIILYKWMRQFYQSAHKNG